MGLYNVNNPLKEKSMDHCTDEEIKSFIFEAFKKMGIDLPDCAVEYVDRELPACMCCPKCHEITGVVRRSTITTDQPVVIDPVTNCFNLCWDTSNMQLEEPEKHTKPYVCAACGEALFENLEEVEKRIKEDNGADV